MKTASLYKLRSCPLLTSSKQATIELFNRLAKEYSYSNAVRKTNIYPLLYMGSGTDRTALPVTMKWFSLSEPSLGSMQHLCGKETRYPVETRDIGTWNDNSLALSGIAKLLPQGLERSTICHPGAIKSLACNERVTMNSYFLNSPDPEGVVEGCLPPVLYSFLRGQCGEVGIMPEAKSISKFSASFIGKPVGRRFRSIPKEASLRHTCYQVPFRFDRKEFVGTILCQGVYICRNKSSATTFYLSM